MAYVLLNELRRLGFEGTTLEHAYVGTIRLRLLKVAAVVTVSVRRIRLAFSSVFPMWQVFRQALEKLRRAYPLPPERRTSSQHPPQGDICVPYTRAGLAHAEHRAL